MKFDRPSLRPLATFAACLIVLVACQNATEPSTNANDPVVVTATFPVNSSRIPDSTLWKAPETSGTQKAQCSGSPDVTCTETFHLPRPLGQDSLTLELWTLGIRTSTIYFGEQGSSATLDLKTTIILRDTLDTLLLHKYNNLPKSVRDSFSVFGTSSSGLVAYYAKLILAEDPSFTGKSLPVGMSADSVEKDLVYLAQKSGLTASQLLAKNLLPKFDSVTVVLDIKILIKAGILNSSDSAALLPPYPVLVKTPIAVNGTVTAGGSAVSVSGSFAWTKGQNIHAPSIQVRTAKSGDSGFFHTPTLQFSSTETGWNLDGELTLQADLSASAGTDTLVVTLSDDAGHSATSRTTFQVVGARDSLGPTIRWTSPATSIGVDASVSNYKVQVSATDPSGVDSVYIQGVAATHDTGSTWYSLVTLGAANGKPLTLVAKALDKSHNVSVDSSVSITRNVPSGTDKPALTILQPSSIVNNTLVFDSATLHLVYKITDLVSLDTASIKFGAVVPKRLTDSTWVADIPVPPTGAPISIVVQAANKNGNGSSESVVVTRAKDATPPVIAEGPGAKSRSVPFDTASTSITWTVSDNYKMASITLNGAAIPLTATVAVNKPLGVGANPFVLVATDSFGNASRDSIVITRSPNATAPVLTRAAADTVKSVPYATNSVTLGWTVSATVGIASVKLNGSSLPAGSPISSKDTLVVGPNTFVLVVTDSTNLSTKDSFVIMRSPNAAAPVLTRAAADTVKSVPYATNSVTLGWTVSATVGIASVKLNGSSLPAGSPISSKDTLVVGPNTFVLVVTDSTNLSTKDSFVITRSPNAAAPVLTRAAADTVKSVPYATNSVTLGWTVSATVGIASVKLNGSSLPAGSPISSKDTLVVGPNTFVLMVTDSTNLSTKDSFVITRGGDVTPPMINAGAGAADATVENGTPSQSISWTVTDNGPLGACTVSINSGAGTVVTGTNGNYTTSVNLAVGANNVTINATDAAGNSATQLTFTITRKDIAATPTFDLPAGTYTSAQPVSLTCAMNGATIYYTLDGNTPTTSSTKFVTGTPITVGATETINAIATANGYTTSLVATRSYTISYDATLKSLKVGNKYVSIPAGGGAQLTADSLPGLTTQVAIAAVANDPAATVKINGGTSGVLALIKDSVTVRIVVTNGNATQTYLLLLSGKHVGTFEDGRDYQTYKAVKIGDQWWMAQNLNFRSSINVTDTVGVCYDSSTANCANYGRLYTWADLSNVQGSCPTGWHVPSRTEWETLINTVEAVPGVGTGNAATALGSKTGWTSGNGTDIFGFTTLPAGEFVVNAFGGLGAGTMFWSTPGLLLGGFGSANSLGFGKPLPGAFSVRCIAN